MSDPYREPIRNANESNEADQPIEKGIDLTEIEKETITIEKEVAELEKKLAEKKAELFEKEKQRREQKEKEKKVFREIIEEQAPSTASSPADDEEASEEDLSGEERFKIHQLKNLSKEEQINRLLKLSFEKGLNEAVKIARALDNPYVLDEFHDKLIDQLYKELVEKGKLKQI